MAIFNFSAENFILVVNGRRLQNFGTEDACTHESIDPVSELKRGLGGDALRLDRVSPGRRYTIHLQAGSNDSGFMQGLMNSKAQIEISTTQLSTLETTLAWEGMIVNDGATNRGSQNPSSDTFVVEFNKFQQTRGSA